MKTKTFSEDQLDTSQAILDEKKNHKRRWRMVHDLLRETNKKAAKEQEKQAKAMAEIREAGIYNNRAARRGQLRFGVSIPNITYQALVAADVAATGKCMLREPEKQKFSTKNATNKIVRDLAEVFPEYKASK